MSDNSREGKASPTAWIRGLFAKAEKASPTEGKASPTAWIRGLFAKAAFLNPIITPVLSALIALLLFVPAALKQLGDLQKDYRDVIAEVKRGADFWIDTNAKYRKVMQEEFDQLLDLSKQSVEIGEKQRESLEDLETTRGAFDAALRLFDNFCKTVLFELTDAHQANPRPTEGRQELFKQANELFDALRTLETHLKDIKVSRPASVTQASRIPEEDLFSGIYIKLMLAKMSSTGVETNYYCNDAEQLIERYKVDFVDVSLRESLLRPFSDRDVQSQNDVHLLADSEYPVTMTAEERRSFEKKRCKCYFYYLKGKLLENRHQYRDALNLYQLSESEDQSRGGDPRLINFIFYRPDYASLGVLEILLANGLATTPSTSPKQWPGNWANDLGDKKKHCIL